MDYSWDRTERDISDALNEGDGAAPSDLLRLKVNTRESLHMREIEHVVAGLRVIVETGSVIAYRQVQNDVGRVWQMPSDQFLERFLGQEDLPGEVRRVLRQYANEVPRPYRRPTRPMPFRDWIQLDEFAPSEFDYLVAITIQKLLPEPLAVASLSYRNPITAWLKIPKLGARAAAAAVNVAKDVRDWDAEKLNSAAEARVATAGAERAERLVDAQVTAEIARLRLENERLSLENQRKAIANDHALDAMAYERSVQQLVVAALRRGDSAASDTYRQLLPADIAALRSLPVRELTAEVVSIDDQEPDDGDD